MTKIYFNVYDKYRKYLKYHKISYMNEYASLVDIPVGIAISALGLKIRIISA